MSVALTTSRAASAASSAAGSNPASRVHSPMYGDAGSCACSPAIAWTPATGVERGALQQELPGEGRAVEAVRAQDVRAGHPGARTLPSRNVWISSL